MEITYDLIVKPNGRLDTNTSSELDRSLTEILSIREISEIYFDFDDLEYISSSGLRVLLVAVKKIDASGGKVHIENVNDTIRNIFSITGFDTLFEMFSVHNESKQDPDGK